MTVAAWGGGGGVNGAEILDDRCHAEGAGGMEQATFHVTPGQTLHVTVAGKGGDGTFFHGPSPYVPGYGGPGGYGGGGNGGTTQGLVGQDGVGFEAGGGGGGASSVSIAGSPLLVAAGGGGCGGNAGSGNYSDGGNDGSSGTNGAGQYGAQGGGPGTRNAGGGGGQYAGRDGARGQGGAGGGGGYDGGGGGGGGYYGGGGGGGSQGQYGGAGSPAATRAPGGGGGGGSDFIAPSGSAVTSSPGSWDASGRVNILWAFHVALSLNPDTVNVCSTTSCPTKVTATATVTGSTGQPVPGESVSFSSSNPGVKIGPVTDHGDGTYTTSLEPSADPGDVTITATDDSQSPPVTGTATLHQDCQPPGPATDAGGASAASVTPPKHCTKTQMRCVQQIVDRLPEGQCVVSVIDRWPRHPTAPTGTVIIRVTGAIVPLPQNFHSGPVHFPTAITSYSTCRLHRVDVARSLCIWQFGSSSETALPFAMSPRIARAFYPGDATHDVSQSSPVPVPTVPVIVPHFWSTPTGQSILKTWAIAQGGGALTVDAVLGTAKAIKDGEAAGGLAAVTNASKFIAGKANPYLTAISYGLKGGALLDTIYALAADPFDPHYKVLAVPHPLAAPRIAVSDPAGRRLVRSYLSNIELQAAVARTLDTTINRASSATTRHDPAAHKLQAEAARKYFRELAGLAGKQLALQQQIAKLLGRLLAKAHLEHKLSLAHVSVAAIEGELSKRPVAGKQASFLRGIGASASYLALYQNATATIISSPRPFNLPAIISNPALTKLELKVASVLQADAARLH